MPSKTTTRLGRCVGTVALALGALVVPLATEAGAASVVTSSSVLAPNLVSTGRAAFYSATWVNDGDPTVANPEVVITLPAGSAVVSADPAVCSVSVPSGPSGAVVVTCERENLASGASITQQLLVRVPTVTVSTSTAVTAVLIGDEGSNDGNKSHTDSFPAPDRALTVLRGDADAAGGCLRAGEEQLATRPGLSAANPLITTAGLAGPTGQLCAPVTVQERAATSPTEACGAGAQCSTDIAVTDFIQVASPPTSVPVQLTFTVVATNRNITWYKNGVPVADCRGATALPAGVDACVNGRSKVGSAGVQLGVLWRAGVDPTWRG
jgi:hypothetical protein